VECWGTIGTERGKGRDATPMLELAQGLSFQKTKEQEELKEPREPLRNLN
jgi:hypothetical protein